ncbi:MAG: DUF5671 domain-containing protein [Pseudomonadales bacterium]
MKNVDRLSKFVHDALAAGRSREEIRSQLTTAGWTDSEIHTALDTWADSAANPPVPKPSPFVSGREVFFHGLLFVALAVTAWHLASLGLSLIDYWLPDSTSPLPLGFTALQIRLSIAFLVVFFPVLVLLNLRATRSGPELRRSLVRKWFCYITLFLAAITLLGNLIYVVHALLSGDLTLRFFAKALLVATVAGAVFLYFRADITEDTLQLSAVSQAVVSLLAAGGIIAGIVTVGGPGQGRLERQDAERAKDLATMAGYIDCLAGLNGKSLPAALVTDERCGGSWRLTDPYTGAPYTYKKLTDTSYQVCARFEALDASNPINSRRFSPDSGCITHIYSMQ